MYRIISGKWKGKKIIAPKNLEVRPTTDFAKEALFNIIEHRFDIEFLSILDLFAGIGSITLEFASRGAKDITSVELNPKHCNIINSIAKKLDFSSQINISCDNVFNWLKRERNHRKLYNIVFADPPFDMDKIKYDALIELILNKDILAKNSIFILEHQSKQKFEHSSLQEIRKYGNISFSFFSKKRDY